MKPVNISGIIHDAAASAKNIEGTTGSNTYVVGKDKLVSPSDPNSTAYISGVRSQL
jgi:hypothetical protein